MTTPGGRQHVDAEDCWHPNASRTPCALKTAGILLPVEHPGQFHAILDYSYPQPPQAFVDQNMSTPPASSYNATLAAADWIQLDYHHPAQHFQG